MIIKNVLLYKHSSLRELTTTGMVDAVELLKDAPLYIENHFVGGRPLGDYTEIGSLQNVHSTGPTQKIVGDLNITSHVKVMEELQANFFMQEVVELEFLPDDRMTIEHVDRLLCMIVTGDGTFIVPDYMTESGRKSVLIREVTGLNFREKLK